MIEPEKAPSNKIEAVRYLAECEKEGLVIFSTEGATNWRMLSLRDLIKTARTLWERRNAFKNSSMES
jgi:hypothetical protein